MTYTFDLIRRQIDAQLDDYEREIAAYGAFMREWRARNGIVEFDPKTGEILETAQ